MRRKGSEDFQSRRTRVSRQTGARRRHGIGRCGSDQLQGLPATVLEKSCRNVMTCKEYFVLQRNSLARRSRETGGKMLRSISCTLLILTLFVSTGMASE